MYLASISSSYYYCSSIRTSLVHVILASMHTLVRLVRIMRGGRCNNTS